MRSIKLLPALGAVLALGAIAAGCGSNNNKSSSGAAGKAGVTLTSPKNGSTVGKTFTATVSLQNFQIDPADVGKQNKPGKGHLHFALDKGKYDYPKYSGPNGRLAKQLGVTGKYSPSVKPAITYKNIPPGKHELEVYLANNDHSNVGPEAKSELTVKPGASGSSSKTSTGGSSQGAGYGY